MVSRELVLRRLRCYQISRLVSGWAKRSVHDGWVATGDGERAPRGIRKVGGEGYKSEIERISRSFQKTWSRSDKFWIIFRSQSR